MKPKKITDLKSSKKITFELSEVKKENSKEDPKAMRHGAMRVIADWFRSNSTPEEKTPFANKLPEKGGKDSDMEKTKRRLYDSNTVPDDPSDSPQEKQKMGILRKFLFVLSLHGGVAYVAVLLWAIPCRHPLCFMQQVDWQQNITAELTSNMEATKLSGKPYSVVFGYSEESGSHLASLSIEEGKMMWNRSLPHYLRHVFCEFDSPLENKRQLCITTAYNFIGAFDITNGEMVWQHDISDPEGEIMHRIYLLKNSGATYVLGVSDYYLFVLNARNGSLVSTISLPCSSTIDIKLTGPWVTKNGTEWTLICEYGDIAEVLTFQEGELLSPPKGNNIREDVQFSLLFRQDSSSGSIDLAGDVTTTPDSLALAWADIVVMVTNQAPFHHLQKTWERRFLGPLGDYLPVTSLIFGHFTDPKKTEIAVAIKNETNTMIHILDALNGSSVAVADLGLGSVISMERITGEKDNTDTLVLESIPYTDKRVNSSKHPSDQTTRSYFTLRFIGNSATYQTLISAEVYAATLSQFSEGVNDLLTATETPDGQTSLRRTVITSPSLGPFCNSNNERNTSTLLILN